MSRTFSKPVAVFVMFCFVLFPNITYALPQGEQVVSGSATFDRSQTNTLTVSQATDKLIANYQSFSIGKPEAVNFLQPSASSVALNRVVGVEPSAILGRLTANGKIFLVNPNGILFGQGSVMDTAGMVASTLNISDSDFLAGRYTFYGQGGSVVNQGYISSPGGYVALLGSTVQNAGVIEANLGSVALASGDAVTLNLDPAGLISVVIDEATTQNLEDAEAAVENTGTIAADGGKVILTAKTLEGVFAKAINTTGIIEADSLNASTGEISLSSNGAVSSTGDMSAKGGTITVCTDDILSLGGNYTADSIVFDPDEVVIDSLQNVSGNTTYWATGNVTVNADVNSSNGFLEFFADATNASNDYDDGIGDFSQAVGTKISGTGDITISGNNVDINGTVETIGAAGTDVEIWIAAGLYGRSGNLNVDNATISATAVAGEGDAPGESDVSVYLWADSETDSSQGNINITDSNVTAQILDNMEEEIEGDGSAYVEIWADYDVTIDPSTVTALVEGDGSAEVWVQSGDDETFGTLTIEESTITAQVEEEGESSVHLIAGVYDESYGGDYDQEVHLSGEGIINISDSTILSSVRNPDEMGEDALVVIEAQDVTIDDSDVTAEVLWRGQARVKLIAGDYDYYHQYWVSQDRYFDGGTLDVLHTSNILASVGNSMDEWNEGAEVVLEGYDIEISGMSAVGSLSQGGGRASTLIVAGDTQEIQSENYHSQFGGSLTVDNSPISAIVSGSGSAEVE
ncbi:MAG: filamentous hemagglutinin N-terminal domain-containing protein, partial [Candidatus Omnitrophica bacterium]|nr:filamentous hemagglutinin N-terminal domain-containing protein [Candidatus Omnitrophota bacterium]